MTSFMRSGLYKAPLLQARLSLYQPRSLGRHSSNAPFYPAAPPPLPPKEQKEWEELIRGAGRPVPIATQTKKEAGLQLHPDARSPLQPDFEGDTNPKTGEIGGPKKEPLQWGPTGEWSYGGRATDF